MFFIFRMMHSGVEFGVKSNSDTLKLILQIVRVLVVIAIFLRFGGLNVEIYDSILQGFNQNNFDYFLYNYGSYFFSACLYVISYKTYYKRVFVGSVYVHSLMDNQLSWDASDWIYSFVFPIHIKEDRYLGENGMVEVYFRIKYSWIKIEKYFVSSIWVGEEKEDVERDLSI